MATPFIGQITMFGGNFAPRGWAFCDGQLLSIAQNTALFSLLGTTYGGNGQTTFALPDLRSRTPVHPGTGPGLPPVALGQQGGLASNVLTVNNLPAHSHSIGCRDGLGDQVGPGGNVVAKPARADVGEEFAAAANASMAPTGNTGGGVPFDNYSPYTAVNFIIALQGIYPSRN